MMIQRTLKHFGALHHYGMALSIQKVSGEVFPVEDGSRDLGPQHLPLKGGTTAEWAQVGPKRPAGACRLTPDGRKLLAAGGGEYWKVSQAIERVIRPAGKDCP